MSGETPEIVIKRAIHEEQSSHVAKVILLELAATGFEIVKKSA